jgi:hypothetical protein
MKIVEAVGLVLGALPLLISAAEHYEDVFKPFHRYRNYAPEVDRFRRQLKTQKAIFRTECRHLLDGLVDPETINQMLDNRKHPLRDESDLRERFSRHLGDSCEACEATAESINETLKVLEDKAQMFSNAVQELPVSSSPACLLCYLLCYLPYIPCLFCVLLRVKGLRP